jgi:capsular exopolysaccharide synthesis family protein
MLSIGAGALYDYLDDRLQTPRRVITATGLLSLGSIPAQRSDEPNKPLAGIMDRRLAESYRLLYRNLRFAMGDSPLRTLMISSPGIGEGKSTTAANLAIVVAQSGQRVTLVDADLHRPSQGRLFELPARVGLATLLLDTGMDIESTLQQTRVPNLRVLSAGPSPADPSALLASKRWGDRLEELQRLGDLVIIDTPPLIAQPDAALVASGFDAVLLVVDARKTRGRAAATAIEMLRDAGAVVQGIVLNRAVRRDPYLDYSANAAGAAEESAPDGAAARAVAAVRGGGQG